MRTAGHLLARRASAAGLLAKTRSSAWAPAALSEVSAAAAHRAWPATTPSTTCWRGLASSAAAPPPGKDGPGNDASHDDFKPTFRGDGDAPASAADIIKADIEGHRVFVYMKGEPEAPQCGFSNMVCRILDAYGVDYGSRNVLADPAIREGVKAFTGWPTIPQVFAKSEFLGGADILMAMHTAGELEAALSGGGGDKKDGHVHGHGCNH